MELGKICSAPRTPAATEEDIGINSSLLILSVCKVKSHVCRSSLFEIFGNWPLDDQLDSHGRYQCNWFDRSCHVVVNSSSLIANSKSYGALVSFNLGDAYRSTGERNVLGALLMCTIPLMIF